MVSLLVNNSEATEKSGTSFGGVPIKNAGDDFQWPVCAYCQLPMQFQGKISAQGKLYQIFMCQNDPGMCSDWEADAGANKVVVAKLENLEYVTPPGHGVVLRDVEHSASVVAMEGDYDGATRSWLEQTGVTPREVLGQLFGEPLWLQADEVPNCDKCGRPMEFLAQLEQGPDWKTEMNFGGGGVAYLFHCNCSDSAKFLWQC